MKIGEIEIRENRGQIQITQITTMQHHYLDSGAPVLAVRSENCHNFNEISL